MSQRRTAINFQLYTQNLKLEQVQVLRQNQGIGRRVQLTADISGSGTLDDPEWKGRIGIPSHSKCRGETLTGVDAEVNVQHQRADVALRTTVEQNALQVRGGVDLGGASIRQNSHSTLE